MNTISMPRNLLILGAMLAGALCIATGCPQRQDGAAGGPGSEAQVDRSRRETGPADPTAGSSAEEHQEQAASSQAALSNGPASAPPSQSAEGATATPQPHAGSSKSQQPLFQGWSEPQLVLLVTGRQQGYIEPCGCTGLANAKGGLARRHTLTHQLAEKGWEVLGLDVGNQVRRFGRQPEIKFQMTVEGLQKMGYHAVAFGPDDLRLSIGELVAATTAVEEGSSPFVCANAAVLDSSLTPRYHVATAGGQRVGITAILGSEHQQQITSDEIILQPAEEGLSEVWPQLQQENCDLYVLLAHTSIEESKALARKFPDFDIVVTAGGGAEPAYEPEPIADTRAVLVQVGDKGMFAGVVGVFDDPQQRLRYQRVPLDSRFSDSHDMLDLLASYQEQLKGLGLDGLGLKPVPHPSGRSFVGSQTCGECHTQAFDVWRNSPHAHATDSLAYPNERVDIPRHHDPECLSCHVTGWNPQKFFPFQTGYRGLEESPLMHANGCENCHGPGSEHVAAEYGDLDLQQEAIENLRHQMRLPLAEAEKKCMECHDLDNSPDFHEKGAFQHYWQQIEHYGKD